MSALNPFNQYSFLLIAAGGLVLLAAGLALTGLTRRKAGAWLVAAAALAVAWLGLRTGPSEFQAADQAELVIRAAERPVLVEFYSDYCAGCLAAKPTLDALERDLKDHLQVIRLDVASAAGRELGEQLDLRVTPTFILFDTAGREIWRSLGSLDGPAVQAALDQS